MMTEVQLHNLQRVKHLNVLVSTKIANVCWIYMKNMQTFLWVFLRFQRFRLKVHYATFLQAVNKQKTEFLIQKQ